VVDQAALRHDVNGFVVNGSAPDLFPVMSLVSIWFIPHETEGATAFKREGASCSKLLNMIDILSLINCPLNRI
jgi:hypothetical protein